MAFFKLLHILIMVSLFSQSLMAVSSGPLEHRHTSEAFSSENTLADMPFSDEQHQQEHQCHHSHGHCHHLHYACLSEMTQPLQHYQTVFNLHHRTHISSTVIQGLYRPPKA